MVDAVNHAAIVRTAPSARWALAALSLSMLLSSLGTSIANVGLPALSLAFDASFQAVQWVVVAYLLAIASLIVGVGRLGDIVGRRRLLLAGIALHGAASVLCGLAPELPFLIAARAVQGLGAAIMMSLSMALVGDTVAKARTGSAMGLLGTMSAAGTALGPSLGGVLIASFGWPAMFLVNVPLGVLAFALAYGSLPADRPATAGSARFDYTGTALLAVTLAAYAYAMTTAHDGFGSLNAAFLAAAVFGAGLFSLAQSRAASPLVRPALFADPALAAGLVASALVSTVMMATMVVGPFYLTRALGLDAGRAGIALSVGPAVAALTGIVGGRVTDRFGARRMTVAGLAGIVAGAAALAALPGSFGVAGYVAPIIVITMGYALFQTANNTAVMADVSADQRGVVSGMLNLSRNLGLITGASAMGAVFAWGTAVADLAAARPEAVAAGMRLTFGIAAVLIVAAIATALRALVARRPSFTDAG